MASSTISFMGQDFDRTALSQQLIDYIETFNRVTTAPEGTNPDDRDFHFRMNQAVQTFGDNAVIDQINYLLSLSGQ